MNREQATVSSDQHPGLPFVPGFGPQLNDGESSPAFFEADLGNTDPLAYNIAKNLTEC